MVVVVLIKVNAFSAGGSTSANGQSSSSNNGSENSNVIRFSDIICFNLFNLMRRSVILLCLGAKREDEGCSTQPSRKIILIVIDHAVLFNYVCDYI